MKSLFSRTWPTVVASFAVLGIVGSILGLSGAKQTVFLVLSFTVVSAALAYAFGRGRRDRRETALDRLGIHRVYQTATEDDDYFADRVASARQKVRILAINIEMLLRNIREPFRECLKRGVTLEVLLARETSELVSEMEKMEVQDGRGPGRSIPKCIREAEPDLRALLQEAQDALPAEQYRRLGKITLGFFNTQYRESMIIVDNDWVWWTPHLNPARGKDRPTFVAEGEDSKFVGLCIRHVEVVQRMSEPRKLRPAREAGTV